MTRGAVRQKSIARRVTAWATLCALLLSALWPLGYMPGAQADDGSFTVVICSASGLKTLTLDASGNPVEEDSSTQSDACAYWLAAAHYLPAPDAASRVTAAPREATPALPRDQAGVTPPATGPPLGAQAPPAFLG